MYIYIHIHIYVYIYIYVCGGFYLEVLVVEGAGPRRPPLLGLRGAPGQGLLQLQVLSGPETGKRKRVTRKADGKLTES